MRIKKLRKERNVSQKDLAVYLGISQSALCQYEKGKRKIPIDILKKISLKFNCTIDELVKGENQK